MTKINMLKGKTKPVVKSRRRLVLWIGIPLVLMVWGYTGYFVYRHSAPQTPEFKPSVEFTLQAPVIAPVKSSSKSDTPEDPYLKENQAAQNMFDLHNVLWFGGKLPNAIVRFQPMEGKYAATVIATIGTQTPVIYINPEYNIGREQIGMNMLHEECHVALGEAEPVRGTVHGKAFRNCMFRLARLGAMVSYW